MLRNFKKNHQSGFTIIEVLIVLAIAGLIMVAVFTAVPALQRSSRNNARKSAASQIMASVSTYVANNNGTLPANTANLTTALNDYKPGFYPLAQIYYGSSATIPASAVIGGAGGSAVLTTEDAIFISGAVCDATNTGATTTGASSRSYVALYAVESGSSAAVQCIGS